MTRLDHNILYTLQLEEIRRCYEYHDEKVVLDSDGNLIEIIAKKNADRHMGGQRWEMAEEQFRPFAAFCF